jgi:uncharacterized protein YjbJ (UPF0337 family)
MDEMEGTIRKVAGKAQENVGRMTGDGRANQDLSGQVQSVAKFIKEQPYTAALIALGIGWFIGRTHRPL